MPFVRHMQQHMILLQRHVPLSPHTLTHSPAVGA